MGAGVRIPTGKSQVAKGFLRNTGTESLKKDPRGPIASRGRSEWHLVKCVDRPPDKSA